LAIRRNLESASYSVRKICWISELNSVTAAFRSSSEDEANALYTDDRIKLNIS
jgi:hypothetical protein